MNKIDSNTVNKTCIYPIAQQIVGVGTTISNAVKCMPITKKLYKSKLG